MLNVLIENMEVSTENPNPMISAILEAFPLPETEPTLTNLDRSTWYTLQLDKINEKLSDDVDDVLSVSIRLGLHPSFVSNSHLEKAQLEAWKRSHPNEKLFDLQFAEPESHTNENKITVNDDNIYSVSVTWNQNKNELPLKIRFNCVSSQFRNSPVFVLVVKVSSKNLNCIAINSYCQIRLFWPGLTAEENRLSGMDDLTESQTSGYEVDIIGQTRLIPYDPIKSRQAQFRANNVNERLFDYPQVSPENFETIANESANQNYLQYSFVGPDDVYHEENRDNFQPFKGIFIQSDVSFRIKIKPDTRMENQFDPEQISVIRFELQKSNQTFTSKEQTEWLRLNPEKTMIEADYTASRFTSNLLDIRTVSVNQIEMILKSNFESEEIAAVKVNCLSKDFSVNGQEMPFKLNIKSVQPTTRTNLGEASFAVVTSNENSSQQMIDKWLNQSLLDSNNINFSKYTIQFFGLVAILVLFLLFYTPFYYSTIEMSNVDQAVTSPLNVVTESELNLKVVQLYEENVDLSENGSLLIILEAPTAAGISSEYPTLTNLDRSTWYSLQMKKLSKTLYNDKLLVSFQIKLNKDPQNLENDEYLNQWKTHHQSERLFDLEYVNSEHVDGWVLEQDQNQIVVDDNQDSQHLDTTNFYWNSLQVANLRIRFNVVNCQFPFKRNQTAVDNITFFFHAKVSSQTQNSSTVIDDFLCQVKLFWTNGAAVANHKANKLVLSSNSDLVSSQQYTEFSLSKDILESKNKIEIDYAFLENLSKLLEFNVTKMSSNTQNYLDYILDNPAMSLVDVITKENEQFKGFFLEENGVFAIKLLTNSKVSSEVEGSIVRTRFELSLKSRPFTEQELLNWSACKKGPMLKVNHLHSQLSDMVYDIRQVSVNCIEMLWLPKLDQLLRDLVIAFNLNSDAPLLVLQAKTIMLKNETDFMALDSATSQIVITEIGQAEASRKNWLKQNVHDNVQYNGTSTQILNDPIFNCVEEFFRTQFNIALNFKLPNFSFAENEASLILFMLVWALRLVVSRMIVVYLLNTCRGKFNFATTFCGALFLPILVTLIYASFKLSFFK